MKSQWITNAVMVNEGQQQKGSVLVREGKIAGIYTGEAPAEALAGSELIDAGGKYLLPGVIDDQVHFREPGLTCKGDIYSEARAAVAGGVTSYMEMPNTVPQTTTQERLAGKFALAGQKSLANYSFYIGATNENIDELLKTDFSKTCGVKIFMGASTGNMLVDDRAMLENIFARVPGLIAVHCEDEAVIRKNTELFRANYGEDVPIACHSAIRSGEACYRSSALAVELAHKHNTRLHVLHLSTAKEMQLFRNDVPLSQKRITAEVCVHHLCFSDADYERYGARIKWNPAIKTAADRKQLFESLLNGVIDVVATDHAPHTLAEKQNTYFKAPSGGPLVQHSLVAMLEFFHDHRITIEQVVEKMCHNPALLFGVKRRGFIREGYWADLVLVDTAQEWQVAPENILYKCGWSPFEGQTFRSAVTHTWVNGNLVYNHGHFDESSRGMALEFGL
ncbi:MAG: dihydroorotase [Bacteroidales bacterium]|jgi:dihydroorotase|nr:dihydroorotase [Bacteroidales bacterium]